MKEWNEKGNCLRRKFSSGKGQWRSNISYGRYDRSYGCRRGGGINPGTYIGLQKDISGRGIKNSKRSVGGINGHPIETEKAYRRNINRSDRFKY